LALPGIEWCCPATTLYRDTDFRDLSREKLRLSEGVTWQALARRHRQSFEFFEKPFALVWDGSAKSDANKLRFAN
jgi:hypothetical protein